MSVDGGDHIPPGWGGVCPPSASAARCGELTVREPRFSPAAALEEPASQAARASWLTRPCPIPCSRPYGSWNFTSLRAAANQQLGGLVSGPGPVLDPATGGCDPLAATNLGEPLDSVQPLLRILPHHQRLVGKPDRGGRGQGVLLADGDLGAGGRVRLLRGGGCRRAVDDCRSPAPGSLDWCSCGTARVTPHGSPGSGSVALSRCAIGRTAGRSTPFGPFRAEAGVGSELAIFKISEWLAGSLAGGAGSAVTFCSEIT